MISQANVQVELNDAEEIRMRAIVTPSIWESLAINRCGAGQHRWTSVINIVVFAGASFKMLLKYLLQRGALLPGTH
jgi:hypothetical protein